MTRAALTLKLLAKQFITEKINEFVIAGIPHGRVLQTGSAGAYKTDRWYYCLYVQRESGWDVVREAHNPSVCVRSWWSLDQCLKALHDRKIYPSEVRLIPRGPLPLEFSKLPRANPTESAKRNRKRAPVAGAKSESVHSLDDDDSSSAFSKSAIAQAGKP